MSNVTFGYNNGLADVFELSIQISSYDGDKHKDEVNSFSVLIGGSSKTGDA